MHRHFILHKPPKYLSQFKYTSTRRKNKKRLGELYDFPEGTMAIGRLDEDSEGLLFLTTNGKVSFEILSRKYEKEYWVQVDGQMTQEGIEIMQKGVEIGIKGTKYITKPCKASLVDDISKYPIIPRSTRAEKHGRPTSWVSIIIREGKFRQVRKMTAAVGFPTLQLVRVRIGEVELDLKLGEVREVEKLLSKD